jgi:hypothetical protein
MRNLGKYLLSKEEVKEALLAEVIKQGVQIDASDTFSINPDGTAEVDYSKDFTIQLPTPVPTLPAGFVVVGEATVFGLNYDGSVDTGDNGLGAWGAKTANKDIIGASIPEEVLMDTLGVSRPWNSKSAVAVGVSLKEGAVQARVTRNGKTILADIVDAGPAAWTHNAIDLTYALAHALDTGGKSVVSYSLISNGKPIQIKGWDSVKGQVT